MKKIHKINSKLNKAGIATLRVVEAVEDLVDDTIEISDRIHLQVGDGYMVLYSKINDERYIVRHLENSNLIQGVQWAIKDMEVYAS